jgi:excisionase family DNA binding protein
VEQRESGGIGRRAGLRELPTAVDTLAPRVAVLEHQVAEDWLLPHEAAERLGIAANTLARWARDEQIRYTVTSGGHRRYHKHDGDALKEKLAKQSRGKGEAIEWRTY